ncbi:MAG: NAD(P)-dependent alcohol dehydrogenase [Bacteroidota bacterium]
MKAFVNKEYGSPEVLNQEEVCPPAPKDREILVQVKSISINPAEWHSLRANIWLIRLASGLRNPRNTVLGADIAGTVVAVGDQVTSFQPGDLVMGRAQLGGLAEYTCLSENQATLLPPRVAPEEAAATPLASITALTALRDKGQLLAGEKVLINGASGGIGTFAVQLARLFGAQVTAVCSSPNIELVRLLGATHTIDYTRQDFTQTGQTYDLVIDLIGNRSVNDLNRIVKPGGRCVLVGYSNFRQMLGFILKGSWLSTTTTKSFMVMNAQTKTEDLACISQFMSEKKIRSVIDRRYAFAEIPQAFNYLGTRRAKGKIVVSVP